MQGFNMGRYVPPDEEGVTSANKLHKKHPLGARGAKSKQGIITVRFEMPYPIWCSSCPNPTIIAQGVRFNAEKKKAGSYYTTPIWSFRIRHAACGGEIEIQTDPKNTAYVVISGAKKRDLGDDVVRDGDMVIMTDAEREKLRQNAFASLEKTIEDREVAKAATHRIDGLLDASSKHWEDPYTQNQRLRKTFRAERKELEEKGAADDAIKDRMSLGIDLLPESEGDRLRASVVDFDTGDNAGDRALSTSLFRPDSKISASASASSSSSSSKNNQVQPATTISHTTTKKERKKTERRDAFMSTVFQNTRASLDPFLQHRSTRGPQDAPTTRILTGIKRKRLETASEADNLGFRHDANVKEDDGLSIKPQIVHDGNGVHVTRLSGLVEYDSD